MAGSKANYLEDKINDYVYGVTSFTPASTLYPALYSVAPVEGSGGTELTGNGYARKSIANNTTTWKNSSSGEKKNNIAIEFAAASGGDWTEAVALAIVDASSGGNMYHWGWLTPPTAITKPVRATASDDLLTCESHGLATNDRVIFMTYEGASIPTGLTANTAYHVISSTTNTFKVSTTQGGSAVNITADGFAEVHKIKPKTVEDGDKATFAIDAIVIKED